jgi:hypothetical protein
MEASWRCVGNKYIIGHFHLFMCDFLLPLSFSVYSLSVEVCYHYKPLFQLYSFIDTPLKVSNRCFFCWIFMLCGLLQWDCLTGVTASITDISVCTYSQHWCYFLKLEGSIPLCISININGDEIQIIWCT